MAFWFVMGVLILPAIIYFTVSAAVEEGTFKALIKYDQYKNNSMQDN
jgi:hypothetical protein